MSKIKLAPKLAKQITKELTGMQIRGLKIKNNTFHAWGNYFEFHGVVSLDSPVVFVREPASALAYHIALNPFKFISSFTFPVK